jgi:hypothetical protein
LKTLEKIKANWSSLFFSKSSNKQQLKNFHSKRIKQTSRKMNHQKISNMNTKLFKSCDTSKVCDFILEFLNKQNERNHSLTIQSFFTPFSAINPFADLCTCLNMAFKCEINDFMRTRYSVDSIIIKNIYLCCYTILIFIALFVILLTSYFLIKYHKSLPIIKYLNHWILCSKRARETDQRKLRNRLIVNKLSTQIMSLNSMNDILITSLLISYVLMILFVVPHQTFLFYTNTSVYGVNCKLSEFLKAFSVTLSIYSLVAIAIQRLIAVKTNQLSCIIVGHRLVDMLSLLSFLSFLKSIGSIVYTFFFSRCYRRYLITSFLILFIWSVSIFIGYYNMSQYKDTQIELQNYEFFESNMACKFDKDLKSSSTYCAIMETKLFFSNSISNSDFLFLTILLIIPNLVVLASYLIVCMHLWRQGNKLNMPLYRTYLSEFNKEEYQMITILRNEETNKIKKNKNMNKKSKGSCSNEVEKSSSKNSLDTKRKHETNDDHNEIKSIGNIQDKNGIENKNGSSNSNRKSVETTSSLRKNINETTMNYAQFTIKKRNMSVTLTTFFMVICFTFCWLPFFTLPLFYSKISKSNTYNTIKLLVHLLGYSSAIFNPIILILKSKRFQNQLRKLIFRTLLFCNKRKLASNSVNREETNFSIFKV